MAGKRCIIGLLACLIASSESLRSRIIGGDAADAGQFPYQVSLQHRMNENLCGGSIIDERYVITAAHCVYNDKENKFDTTPVRIVAGTTAFSSRVQRKVIVEVEEIFIPTEYDPTIEPRELSAGDIAVLKLAKDIGLKKNRNIGTIKLPTKVDTYKDVEATVSGFGWVRVDAVTDPKTGKPTEVNGASFGRLNFAKAKVVPLDDCQKKYLVATPGPKHLCAGVVQRNPKTPEGVCKGDSGGPLAHGNTLIGVLSSSPKGCNENVKPGIYTKVDQYLSFIDKVVGGKIDGSIRSQKLDSLTNDISVIQI